VSPQADHQGESLPRAIPAFEERAGVPTWTVAGRTGAVSVAVVRRGWEIGQAGEPEVSIAGKRLNEAQARELITALEAARSRLAA